MGVPKRSLPSGPAVSVHRGEDQPGAAGERPDPDRAGRAADASPRRGLIARRPGSPRMVGRTRPATLGGKGAVYELIRRSPTSTTLRGAVAAGGETNEPLGIRVRKGGARIRQVRRETNLLAT
jgi:hypothetical protein